MTLFKNLTWNQLMALCGLAAIATLMGVGVVDKNAGLPYLTGILGLTITMKEAPTIGGQGKPDSPAPPAA